MENEFDEEIMMQRKVLIKSVVFIILLMVFWKKMDNILEKYNGWWDHTGMDSVYKKKDFYDVIFVGTSITITNISNEEMYLKYGIAGTTIGAPSQPTYLSYYSLEEALKYQNPKVVMFDVNSLFYTEEELKKYVELDEQHYLHYTLDGLKNNLVKYKAFRQAKELTPWLDFWNYFSFTYYNHANWEELHADNFQRSSSVKMNGNLMLMEPVENWVVSQSTLSTEKDEEALEYIPEINEHYLKKIVNLCSEKNILLVLIRGGGTYTWGKYNKINSIAKQYDIPYIDLYGYETQMRFDLRENSWDGNHFNVSGAEKWTNVLGEYLIKNYEFVDRRNDKKYDKYKEQEIFYNSVVKVTNDNIELRRAKNFDSYLETLRRLDFADTTVFISVKDDASTNLTYDEIWQMNELGLCAELKNKLRYSYIGIFGEAGIHEFQDEEQLCYSEKIGEDTSYAVTSSGWNAGNQASIIINGVERAQNGRGINIVVYNSALDKVISSVYFDTHQYENPPTARISTVSQEQYESEPNIWLPLENYQAGEPQ